MKKNFMPWSNHLDIGFITCCQKNLSSVQSDHEALKYLNSQQKLSVRHAHWVEYLQSFTFVLKHKARSENRAADALSQRLTLLSMSQVEVIGFEKIKEEYPECPDFEKIYIVLSTNNTRRHE